MLDFYNNTMKIDPKVHQFLKEIGKAGGEKTKAKYGKAHYSRLGTISMAKRYKKLISLPTGEALVPQS